MGGGRGLGRGGVFQAGAVEGVGADLAFVAGSRDFLAVEKEADGGGVAGADDDLAAGAEAKSEGVFLPKASPRQ